MAHLKNLVGYILSYPIYCRTFQTAKIMNTGENRVNPFNKFKDLRKHQLPDHLLILLLFIHILSLQWISRVVIYKQKQIQKRNQ